MTDQLVLIVFSDFQLLDAAGPIAAFEMANRLAPASYALTLASESGGAVRSSSGVSVLTQAFANVKAAHSVLAVGGAGVEKAASSQQAIDFISSISKPAQRVASVCSGAWLLAAAGLLAGRKATTHWQFGAAFRRRFADVSLDEDRIYVQDGKIWTAAGISAGIDLALAWISADLGEKIARQVARQLVVYYRRPGGQSQYSALLEMGRTESRFSDLLDYIRGNLHKTLTVDKLARQVCMSPRHFARCFVAETGVTPAQAVERLRVEAASAALQSGAGSVQLVARQCGFSNAERMRRAFIRLKGAPPSAMKRPFREGAETSA